MYLNIFKIIGFTFFLKYLKHIMYIEHLEKWICGILENNVISVCIGNLKKKIKINHLKMFKIRFKSIL